MSRRHNWDWASASPLPALAASLVLVTARARARLLRRAERRRPGLLAADLLLPRLDRVHRVSCFGSGAWKALLHLWKRDPNADLESYVAIHQGVDLRRRSCSSPGSIWAKDSWGHWWLWSENQLVLFLVLFLFYCRVLHAALLGRRRAAAREPLRGVRALRRRADPGQLPGDPAGAEFHPSGRLHAARRRIRRLDARHVLRRAGRDARARVHALSSRARGKRLDARLRELREAYA